LRFDLLFGVGDGVGETFFDFGEAVGVGVGVVFFFRCLRDELGVGSGSNVFLIFVPNDSCAGYAVGRAPNAIATAKNHLITVLNAISFVGRFCETPIVVSAVLSGESSPVVRPDAMRTAHTTAREIARLATASPSSGGQDARQPHRQDVCATTARALEGWLC